MALDKFRSVFVFLAQANNQPSYNSNPPNKETISWGAIPITKWNRFVHFKINKRKENKEKQRETKKKKTFQQQSN